MEDRDRRFYVSLQMIGQTNRQASFVDGLKGEIEVVLELLVGSILTLVTLTGSLTNFAALQV